jgi:membrane protease YdiL (CAAX protease family)
MIKNWIKEHQVAAFFLLAFLITWPGFFLTFFIFPGNQILEVIASWVVFGPALGALIVSAIADPGPKLEPDRKRWITFLIVWVIASIVQVLYFNLLYQVELILPIIIVCCVLALFPAWMVSSAFARNPGIRDTFSTLIKPRGSWTWYLVIFLIFPGIPLASVLISRLIGNPVPFFRADLGLGGMAAYFCLEFSRGFLMTGGVNEESGWRGFALPRLQGRYPVLVSALIVWFFWAAWHLPYDFGRGDELSWILENRLLWNLLISILLTWLYNRTNGSLLAPALLHPAMNTFGNMISFTPAARVLIVALTIFAIFFDRMWKKLPEDHPAVVKRFTERRMA